MFSRSWKRFLGLFVSLSVRGAAPQCRYIKLFRGVAAGFVVKVPSYNLYFDAKELVISITFSSLFHSSINASSMVLLSHDGKINTVPLLTLRMLPCAFMDVFLFKPCIAYCCLIQSKGE